jgi:hypothetical protein
MHPCQALESLLLFSVAQHVVSWGFLCCTTDMAGRPDTEVLWKIFLQRFLGIVLALNFGSSEILFSETTLQQVLVKYKTNKIGFIMVNSLCTKSKFDRVLPTHDPSVLANQFGDFIAR